MPQLTECDMIGHCYNPDDLDPRECGRCHEMEPDMKDERVKNSGEIEHEWRTIESAPMGESGKPETYILISKQEQGTTLVATGYRNAHGAYEWFGGGMMGITHWMPLPKPPGDLK